MRKHDYSKKDLISIPLVSEAEEVELNLSDNNITQLSFIPEHCRCLNLAKNK